MTRIIDRLLELIDRALCHDCDDNAPHGMNTEEEMDVGYDLSDP